ncbi:BRO family protein [Clostridium sp.]|uniref:BRO family protein n=1 Tax=Clostridium sp. TaxID=1506 RepID=UPI003217AE9B
MKYYTVDEAAKKLKVSTGHVYELVKRGEIKKKEGMGRAIRIPSSELGKVSTERNYFTYNADRIEVIQTHLGKVRKLKDDNFFICVDIIKSIGIKDSYAITKVIDKKYTRLINRNEAKELGIFVNQCGILVVSYSGLEEYSKRSMCPIDWGKFLTELNVDNQISIDEAIKEPIESMKLFEGRQVEIIIKNGQPLFELYSTGIALGQADIKNGKAYPKKARIEQNIINSGIELILRNGEKYLTETQLYDFMLEAKTEKCKAFRKWVTNEVLPTIRKTGGYVDNSEKFVDNYFRNLSKTTKEIILVELENKNKILMAERVKIDKELLDNADVIEKIQETL